MCPARAIHDFLLKDQSQIANLRGFRLKRGEVGDIVCFGLMTSPWRRHPAKQTDGPDTTKAQILRWPLQQVPTLRRLSPSSGPLDAELSRHSSRLAINGTWDDPPNDPL